MRGLLAAGEVTSKFFVKGDATTVGDLVVDLAAEQAIPADLLLKGRHLATIATWQWHRLLVQLAVDRWHLKPETLFHPDLDTGGGPA